MEMSVYDVEEAKWDEEFSAFLLRNENYKTSLLYGAKIIVISECLHKLFKSYIKNCRPFFVDKCPENKKQSYQKSSFLLRLDGSFS